METKLTNEEKAKKIVLSKPFNNASSQDYAYKCAMEMAKWKDEQIQSVLNGLPPSIHDVVKSVAEASGINFENFY